MFFELGTNKQNNDYSSLETAGKGQMEKTACKMTLAAKRLNRKISI